MLQAAEQVLEGIFNGSTYNSICHTFSIANKVCTHDVSMNMHTKIVSYAYSYVHAEF